MSQTIGSYEAKTRLPEILRRVEAGESFVITNRGKPVAEIIPSDEGLRRKRKAAIENILARPKGKLSTEKLDQYRAKGRK